MTTQRASPPGKICPNCESENGPLAPSCSRCGFDFRGAMRAVGPRRNRNLGYVAAGVAALVLTGFGSYWAWWFANEPGPTPRPTAILRVALAATPRPSPTITFSLTADANIVVHENCCNPRAHAYSQRVIAGLAPTTSPRSTSSPRAAVSPSPPASRTFQVTNSKPELFAEQPAIDGSGMLSFRTAPNRDGVAVIGVATGEAPGTVLTFTITIEHVNQPPVANDDAGNVAQDGSTAIDVLTNDYPGPPNEQAAGAHPGSMVIVAVTPGTAGGSVEISADGKRIDYRPPPGFSGTETFRYQIQDDGGLPSGLATVEVTVTPAPSP